ncbi:hypothetical protein BDW59DRAFT_172990 [Aspergillus cavernicola]|uniref:Saponin hydrolase n=1 Tax=Aspergillus cavernicola TaxID=176166 RepID=A0ABR4I953_9EURO
MAVLSLIVLAGLWLLTTVSANKTPRPPWPEPIDVVELLLPPVISRNETGACTAAVNPRGTGCIGQVFNEFQSGDFTPDGDHVVVNVEFIGASSAPDPASIYSGEQVILVKTDGTNFSNGDPWKCISCGISASNAQSLDPQKDYPHVFRSGTKVLWGHNILVCGNILVSSDKCKPENTYIYPLYWPISADGSGPGGVPRELRLHPDDEHIGWSSFTSAGGQHAYFGRLQFNPSPSSGDTLAPRYDLVDVSLLMEPNGLAPIMANGNELELHDQAITVGELRGFSGSGDEITYIGSPREANNIDVFAVHLITGAVRRLTSHPEYTDPLGWSYDNGWFVAMDTRGTDRQMWMSGMRMIPPVIDLITVTAASSTRNNGLRRFFQPILIDCYGDRGDYFGQQINAGGNGSNGAINDPNWNGRADPAFSYDGTKIVYWQALVTSPSCGGANPLKCPESTAEGGRRYRAMLAHLKRRKPTKPAPVFKVPKNIPWAIPFPPGASVPPQYILPTGNYTLKGKSSGIAHATLIANPSTGDFKTISVSYKNYSDDNGDHIISGFESVTSTKIPGENPWMNHLDWSSDLKQTGVVNATKITSPGGFQMSIDAMVNIFSANGTLTTTIDGAVYRQPANGT